MREYNSSRCPAIGKESISSTGRGAAIAAPPVYKPYRCSKLRGSKLDLVRSSTTNQTSVYEQTWLVVTYDCKFVSMCVHENVDLLGALLLCTMCCKFLNSVPPFVVLQAQHPERANAASTGDCADRVSNVGDRDRGRDRRCGVADQRSRRIHILRARSWFATLNAAGKAVSDSAATGRCRD